MSYSTNCVKATTDQDVAYLKQGVRSKHVGLHKTQDSLIDQPYVSYSRKAKRHFSHVEMQSHNGF